MVAGRIVECGELFDPYFLSAGKWMKIVCVKNKVGKVGTYITLLCVRCQGKVVDINYESIRPLTRFSNR